MLKKELKKKKYFRFKKELTQNQIKELRFLGDKSIRFEEQITRFYPHMKIYLATL